MATGRVETKNPQMNSVVFSQKYNTLHYYTFYYSFFRRTLILQRFIGGSGEIRTRDQRIKRRPIRWLYLYTLYGYWLVGWV